MFKGLKMVLAALATAGVMGGAPQSAEAQNYNLRPSFGSHSLVAGFVPDPWVRSGIQAGGDNRFSGSGGCPGGGWFANAPDFSLHYNAGGYALTFYVRAPGDTMLLINDPNTRWYCNDDHDGLDPVIRFGNPSSGRYDIWLGTYNRSRVRGAQLYVTELR